MPILIMKLMTKFTYFFLCFFMGFQFQPQKQPFQTWDSLQNHLPYANGTKPRCF
jgi:hypothetical protein